MFFSKETQFSSNLKLFLTDIPICFTDENYPDFAGWGHSTWQEGVKLCDAASVKKLVIFHHDPGNDDAAMDIISEEANKARPGSLVAMEGMELEVQF